MLLSSDCSVMYLSQCFSLLFLTFFLRGEYYFNAWMFNEICACKSKVWREPWQGKNIEPLWSDYTENSSQELA